MQKKQAEDAGCLLEKIGPIASEALDALGARANGKAKILNRQVLENWQRFFDNDAFAEFLYQHVDGGINRLASLTAEAARENIGDLQKIAHNFKSICGAIGLMQAFGIVERMEKACMEGRGTEAVSLLPDLTRSFEQSVDTLREQYGQEIEKGKQLLSSPDKLLKTSEVST